jgi:hypothetical protein
MTDYIDQFGKAINRIYESWKPHRIKSDIRRFEIISLILDSHPIKAFILLIKTLKEQKWQRQKK